MAPVRVGIVGLSIKPGAWATLAHLPRLAKSPNYQIVAVCNSSIESSKAAIKELKLPESTRAYDTYDDLAADKDVDLYVVSTRADTHYNVAMPALKAGRNVFVEWPLAANTEQAKEMAAIAKEKNLRTIIGLQGRMSPSVKKVKQLVESGALGEIHSVNFQGAIHVWQNNAASDRYHYFMDRKIGGNLLTIYGGHILDSVLYAVGELKPGSYTPLAVNLRRKMHLMKSDGSLTEELYDKDTPDQILLQGQLERHPSAVLSFHLRAGDRFIGSPGSIWRIYGTKGELAVEFASAGPQMAKATSFRFSNSEKGEIEEFVTDEGGEEWTDLPTQAQNIGRLYEAYATGEPYADFDLAVKRHELLDEFWATLK
ncbi:transcription regulator gal80 [Cladophialophora chaetospira]|uniref:Transcription regulator gal80 n=1 Tax=Cladophialophora chaetospira TaxID=386627 RepID=A0AA39CER5_9EURO|nr:transcription regulator gal80 [Cladophialophora chaetospira]